MISRRLMEKVYIGDDVEIVVVDIDRGKIRLGITAPPDVKIYRDEILPADHPMATKRVESQP